MFCHTDHERITRAGWSYRLDNSGWLIYRDPRTGVWHNRRQALAILGRSDAAAAAGR